MNIAEKFLRATALVVLITIGLISIIATFHSPPPPPPPPPAPIASFTSGPWLPLGTGTLNRSSQVVRIRVTDAGGAPLSGVPVTWLILRGPINFPTPAGATSSTDAAGIASTSIRANTNRTGRGAISAVGAVTTATGTVNVVQDSPEFEVDGTN